MKEQVFKAYEKFVHEVQDYFEYRYDSKVDKEHVSKLLEKLHADCKAAVNCRVLLSHMLGELAVTPEKVLNEVGFQSTSREDFLKGFVAMELPERVKMLEELVQDEKWASDEKKAAFLTFISYALEDESGLSDYEFNVLVDGPLNGYY